MDIYNPLPHNLLRLVIILQLQILSSLKPLLLLELSLELIKLSMLFLLLFYTCVFFLLMK